MTKRAAHRTKSALRHCYLLSIALWALAFTPYVAVAQTYDDPVAGRLTIPPSPSDSLSSTTSDLAATRPSRIVRGPCDPDYWIVSTRGAKDLVDCGQAVKYGVMRFDGTNPCRTSSMEELLASLQPGVPVCFMVHGSFVEWDSVLNDSAQTYRWLRQAAPEQPVHMIFYTWDSDDGGCLPHLRVNMLGRRAAMNGFYLADLVSKVSCDHPICLIGHSHGTRTVSAALHVIAGGSVENKVLSKGPLPVRQIRVVMAAAAIDHVWLNPDRRYGRALCPAEAMINLRNPADFPLMFYPLRRPISYPALAITGLTRKDRAEMGDWNLKYVDYDVSGYVGLGHIWAHYYNQPAIASIIRHYVYFDETNSPSAN